MVFRHPLRPWVLPVSRYFRLPASQEGCWGAYAVLLGVSDGGTDSRNDHGGMRDWRTRMTVDRNRHHHAEPRQQVIAATALSWRDDPMTARPLTQSSRVRRPPWLWDHSTTAHTPTSWPSLSPRCRCESQRILLGGGTQRAAVLRRTFADSVGASAELCREHIPGADLGVPSPTSRLIAFTGVFGCWPTPRIARRRLDKANEYA
jgi:hypothetical protein